MRLGIGVVCGGGDREQRRRRKRDRQINAGREVDGGQKKGFWKTSHLEFHLCSLVTELISSRFFCFVFFYSNKHTHTHRLCSKTYCVCLPTAYLGSCPLKALLQQKAPGSCSFSVRVGDMKRLEATRVTFWHVSAKFRKV